MKYELNYEQMKDLVYFDIQGRLNVGLNVKIEPFASILCWHKVTIGDNTMIASGVRIVDFDHDLEDISKKGHVGEIKIGKRCWIGSNAVILKGVKLGDDCIVGAGAVVTHSFPKGSIITGVPGKLLRKR